MHKVRNICLSAKSGRATPLRGNSPAFHLGTGGHFPNFYFLGGVPGFAGPGLDGPGLAGGWPGFQGSRGFCTIGIYLLSWRNLYSFTQVALRQGRTLSKPLAGATSQRHSCKESPRQNLLYLFDGDFKGISLLQVLRWLELDSLALIRPTHLQLDSEVFLTSAESLA